MFENSLHYADLPKTWPVTENFPSSALYFKKRKYLLFWRLRHDVMTVKRHDKDLFQRIYMTH
jgi:hypothetical protein